MKTKYPPIEPRQKGFLEVDAPHKIYWEESGNPKGIPVIFLHGGPGSGTDPGHRCYFNPESYRIILLDQRGSGKSTPFSCLENNTTWDLIKDLERLREHLKVEKWLVFGGSWGSTLALSYAETHPERVEGLILRGIFLGRRKDIDWFYQQGASRIYRDAWEDYLDPIPEEERGDLLSAYHKRLFSKDNALRKRAASSWSAWEGVNLKLRFEPEIFAQFTEDNHADALARIECHYFVNGCFFPTDNFLLENIDKIRHIPAVIIHGRYDMICPFEGAWELHRMWPEAEFIVVPDAGHAASEPGILDALVEASDSFALKRQAE